MKICNKCKVEQDEKKYYTYYHSVQKKHRTRLICLTCTRKQGRDYKVKIKEQKQLLNKPPEQEKIKDVKEKTCVTCLVVKTVDDFYKNRLVCKRCCTDMEKRTYQDKTYERLQKNGGSLRIPKKPGIFHDEYQKHYTHEILLAMGWTLNEENGMWWKEGIKNKDGIFTDVRKFVRIQYEVPHRYTLDEKMEKIIMGIDLRNKGNTYVQIGKIMDLSATTIRKWLIQYEKK